MNYAATIPAQFKQRGICGKWVLKKVMEPYLPHNVIYRSKTGFGVPLRSWMKNELRDIISDVLNENTLKSRGIFKYESVNRLINANDRDEIDASYTILSLLFMELWCQKYFD